MIAKTEVDNIKQTDSGKAFEYAVTFALYNKIKTRQRVQIKQNVSFFNAKRSFEKFTIKEQQDYNKAAEAGISHIAKLEPRIENPIISNDEIIIIIQSDQKGIIGDIRDIITIRSKDNWEIGFSAKNNHMAVKHSRLSGLLDFGEKWFNISCSHQYKNEVKQIFDELKQIIKENKDKKNFNWSDLGNKKMEYYRRVLNSFELEILRLYKSNINIPELLLRYLLGVFDFYKIMKFDSSTKIQGFNLYGTLNKPFGSINPIIKIPRLKFPSRIENTRIINNTTLHIYFDKGWQLSFRIHNAKKKLEASLKFDIQLFGIPSNLYKHDEPWKKT
jgi:hypothetical protein